MGAQRINLLAQFVLLGVTDVHGGVTSTKVFAGDRHQVREQSILFALEGLFSRLS